MAGVGTTRYPGGKTAGEERRLRSLEQTNRRLLVEVENLKRDLAAALRRIAALEG